jgi:cytoskeletal protein CcmA (bactofilin family)
MSKSNPRPAMTRPRLLAVIISAVTACTFSVLCSLAAADDDDDPRIRDTLSGNYAQQQFLAGERVEVSNANVADDIFAAGQEVKFDTVSANHVIAAGGSLWLTNLSVDDLILAGWQMDLSGTVKDDVIAAACPVCPVGGTVHLSNSMQVGDQAHLVAREVSVDGKIGGNLYAVAQRVELSGVVGGDAHIEAQHIVLKRDARIDGNLRWAGPSAPEMDEGAVVAGQIVEVEPIIPFEKEGPEHPVWWYVMMGVLALIGVLLAFVLLVAVVQWAVPGLLASAAATARTAMWASLGRGLAVALLGPAVVALLMASVIGIPIGMITSAALFLLFVLGFVAISYCIGLYLRGLRSKNDVISSSGGRILWTVIGMFVMFIVALIPFIGWVVDFLAVIAGVGAVVSEIGPLLRGARTASATR